MVKPAPGPVGPTHGSVRPAPGPNLPPTMLRDYQGLIKRLELHLGLTGKEMAAKLGVTPQAYSEFKQGDNAKLHTLAKLEAVTGIRLFVLNPLWVVSKP